MAVTPEEIVRYLIGARPDATQREIVKDVFSASKGLPGVKPKMAAKVGRFAGRIAPGVSAVGNIVDAVDLVTGEESFSNKAMDVASMGIGGTVGGMLGGPLGASMGASAGKAASDGLQFLFGGGKSAEQRKLEEALLALKREGLV